jgi:hypothetical protein
VERASWNHVWSWTSTFPASRGGEDSNSSDTTRRESRWDETRESKTRVRTSDVTISHVSIDKGRTNNKKDVTSFKDLTSCHGNACPNILLFQTKPLSIRV